MRGLLIVFFTATASAQPAPQQIEDPRLPWRMGSLACLGGGVVALAFGVMSYGMGSDDENLVKDAERDGQGIVTGLTQREALRLQDSAERAKNFGALGFALGGLLVTTGAVLYILEPPPGLMTPTAPDPEIRPFSFVPTFGPDGAGLAAQTTF